MPKKNRVKSQNGGTVLIKTNFTFEELMKKALNTPLPKKQAQKKK